MANDSSTHDTDLLIIGGGPGGYSTAFRAAAHGITTAIVETSGQLGGVCLHCGCIPSKTLLGIAETLTLAKHAQQMGITFAEPTIDVAKVGAWKGKVITKLTRALGATAKKSDVNVIKGTASFVGPNEVAVSDGDLDRITFKRAIIATGSRPIKLGSIQIDSNRVQDSTQALDIDTIPGNVLVIGGGYIGLELGSVFDALGSEVTVVEMLPSLLAGCDADLARPLIKRLEKSFAEICLSTRVTGMKEVDGGIEVSFEGEDVPKRTTFERVLVSVGRRPDATGLGLDTIGVKTTERGFIQTNKQFQTSCDNIYAIGDIIGNPMLAHKAIAEGRVVADILAGKDAQFAVKCIPAVVFTDPEIAWVGLNETEAKAQGIEVETKMMQWITAGRAVAMGRTDGLTKIVFEPGTKRVLGVGLAGPHVGEMIAEGALAIEMGATADDIARTVHPHPTTSELICDVADMMATGMGPAH